MNIAKRITAATYIALAVLIAAACGSSPQAAAAPDELDAAIREASDYLDSSVPAGNKIVILNVQSDSAALSDYIIDELIANAVNDRNFAVVDRQQLDALRSELNFQWAGEVDDNSAQEIGKMVGAQTIVSGAISKLGDNYRMRIRALEVQTAQVQGQFNRNIPSGATITALMNSSSKGYSSSGGAGTVTAQTVSGGSSSGGSGGTQTAQAGGNSGTASGGGSGQAAQAPAAPAAPAAPVYKIGDTGPAGGLIFYDKGNNSGGWRYLEAAPANTEKAAAFGDYRVNANRRLGSGKENTQQIMDAIAKNGGGINTAPFICDGLVVNGFDDWYLPSADELLYMYNNLYANGLGNFRAVPYWSSGNGAFAYDACYSVNFSTGDGEQHAFGEEGQRYQVRAVRQF
ncbi:hypothetical protein AGMMS49587_05340 [Spirochaetia bacterium]|nr:hypothetical protein AGMMS49587_05340 [Spirochaetia bacterium]